MQTEILPAKASCPQYLFVCSLDLPCLVVMAFQLFFSFVIGEFARLHQKGCASDSKEHNTAQYLFRRLALRVRCATLSRIHVSNTDL